jgi:transposase-like protein
MDKPFLERCLAEGMSLPQIGELTGRDPSTVGYWVQQHGLVANGKARYAPRGGLTREQLEPLVESGATLQEMANALGRATSTVRYWLQKYGVTTLNRRGPRPRADEARAAGLTETELECPRHGSTTFVLRSRGYWSCRRCNSEAVARWRRRKKRRLIEAAGGRCQLCGYQGYDGALHFHHLDPTTKQFALSRNGITRSLAEALAEAEKCVLLCANCHAEIEGGVASLPNE